MDWVLLISRQVMDKGSVSGTYKEYLRTNKKRTRNPIAKWAKAMGRHLSDEGKQTANHTGLKQGPHSTLSYSQSRAHWVVSGAGAVGPSLAGRRMDLDNCFERIWAHVATLNSHLPEAREALAQVHQVCKRQEAPQSTLGKDGPVVVLQHWTVLLPDEPRPVTGGSYPQGNKLNIR